MSSRARLHDNQRISRPGWRRRNMIICIAAICEHECEGAIVSCADSQSTYGGMLKSEDQQKMRGDARYTILMAGYTSEAEELQSLVLRPLDKFLDADKDPKDFDIRISDLLADLRVVVRKQKRAIVEHYLGVHYSLTRDEFFKEGKNNLSPKIYSRIISEISQVGIGADLLISSVVDAEPVIIHISGDGYVRWEASNYACIGSGADIARSILCQNDWKRGMSLLECLAHVYSAKYAAEKDPYVGKTTGFDVLVRGKGSYSLSTDGFKHITSCASKIIIPLVGDFDPKYLTLEWDINEKE